MTAENWYERVEPLYSVIQVDTRNIRPTTQIHSLVVYYSQYIKYIYIRGYVMTKYILLFVIALSVSMKYFYTFSRTSEGNASE